MHGTFFSRNHFSGVSVEELDYDTSVSRCESERGTHGRGTPPVREVGQPQLDDLFRKLQVGAVECKIIEIVPCQTGLVA